VHVARPHILLLHEEPGSHAREGVELSNMSPMHCSLTSSTRSTASPLQGQPLCRLHHPLYLRWGALLLLIRPYQLERL